MATGWPMLRWVMRAQSRAASEFMVMETTLPCIWSKSLVAPITPVPSRAGPPLVARRAIS